MKFVAKTKPVKADLTNKTITISFTVDMTDEDMLAAEELAFYADKDAGQVEILVTPRQENMFAKKGKAT
jgi:hypothetical protein